MFCLNCGKELPDDAKFCSGCGKQIETKEKEIINTVPVCSSCGEKIITGNKFCIKCGNPVVANDKLIQTTNQINPEFSSTMNNQEINQKPILKEITLTKEQKNTLIGRAAGIATAITLPLCIVIGFLADSLGIDNIIALPVFIVCYPFLCVIFYKRLKRNIMKKTMCR